MTGLVGYGETGRAIARHVQPTAIHDPPAQYYGALTDCAVIHVCVPPDALAAVPWDAAPDARWIIHTTTRVGQCRTLPGRVVHAPIEGQHPRFHLERWRMPVSGPDAVAVGVAVNHLRAHGIPAEPWVGPWERTELAKLLSTLRLGWEVLFRQHAHDLAETLGLDDATDAWTAAYNARYADTRFPRSALTYQPGPIGGHCVLPNAELLATDSWIARLVVERGR